MDGQRLRSMREMRQLSQADLGDRVGVSDKQIYRYEPGMNDPTAEVLLRMSRELECSADYLLGLVDDPKHHATEADLTSDERKILSAYRRNDLRGVLEILSKPREEVK